LLVAAEQARFSFLYSDLDVRLPWSCESDTQVSAIPRYPALAASTFSLGSTSNAEASIGFSFKSENTMMAAAAKNENNRKTLPK
jgi:hypothetical protein